MKKKCIINDAVKGGFMSTKGSSLRSNICLPIMTMMFSASKKQNKILNDRFEKNGYAGVTATQHFHDKKNSYYRTLMMRVMILQFMTPPN